MSLEIQTRREFLSNAGKVFAFGVMPFFTRLPLAQNNARGTGYIYSDKYLDHLLYQGHPESPERLIKIQARMKALALDREVTPIAPLEFPVQYIQNIHTTRHILSVSRLNITGPVAQLAAAGALGAVKAVCDGTVKNAFCAIRPPGHHAGNSGMEEGFCFYNNVAIAARYAQQVYNHEKILIIDWDYHHGNGTEDAFYYDPTVLFFSTHNWHAYPKTGSPSRRGRGRGLGFNINVHLGPGANDKDILTAWDKDLLPQVEKFKPNLVLISAGFDSRIDDRLGTFYITDDAFAKLTNIAMDIADSYCEGRLVSLLEGGYNVEGQAKAAATHVRALLDRSVSISPTPKTRKQAIQEGKIINLSSEKYTSAYLEIFDLTGHPISCSPLSSFSGGKINLNRMSLPPGRYVFKILLKGASPEYILAEI